MPVYIYFTNNVKNIIINYHIKTPMNFAQKNHEMPAKKNGEI